MKKFYDSLSNIILNLKIKISFLYRQGLNYRIDILLLVALTMTVGISSYQRAQLIHPSLFEVNDVWFQADTKRNFDEMSSYEHLIHTKRIKAHPLFPMIAYSLVNMVRATLDLEPIVAVRLVIAVIAAIWISVLFIVLRLIGCKRLDAILFSLLAAISAATMFWFSVPETYPFGSLSILLALCLTALAQNRIVPWFWYFAISALTLSFLITNWMTGILSTIANYQWKRSLLITTCSLSIVIILFIVQNIFFFPSVAPIPARVGQQIDVSPSTSLTLAPDRQQRLNHLLPPEAGGPLHIAKVLIFHGMAMPSIQKTTKPGYPIPLMTIQRSLPGSGSLWGMASVVLWAALLGLGLWTLFSIEQHRQFRFVLGLTLLGQLALYILYGEETFLYTLNFTPLLVVMTALSTLTRVRQIALVLVVMLVLNVGINNSLQFTKAKEFLQDVSRQAYRIELSTFSLPSK